MTRLMHCAATLALLAATPVLAGQSGGERQMIVGYDDINVRQPAGAQILVARIDAASHVVCGPAPDMRELSAWPAYRSCTSKAMDRAVASLPFDLMAALEVSHANEAVASR
jgi:UrcA family protein